MLYYNDYWQHGQAPPDNIFQKPQTAALLFAALFFFDSFREYPLSNLRGYSRKLLNCVGKICEYFPFRSKFYKKQREISASVGKWCAARAPPLWNVKSHFSIQISGGVAMSKISKQKIFLKFFWNHQVSLGDSQLGLFVERIIEGGEHMGVYERRLMLLEMLSVANLVTYSRLAEDLGVSIETIRTDIIALMCLYPIETVRGCNGGVKLTDRPLSRRKTLTDDQTSFLIRIRARFDNEELEMLDSIILQLAAQ